MTAPILPKPVSITGSVDPSPKPQISRSIAVGISLRCLPARLPSGAKNSTVQYSVPPARSIAPITSHTPCARAASPSRAAAECLGKNDQPRAGAGGFRDQPLSLSERGVAVEQDRTGLHHRHARRGHLLLPRRRRPILRHRRRTGRLIVAEI